VDVGLLGPMPTPAIAYLTRTFQASAGIVISASHNSYTDNGVKLFNTQGTKLADEVELAIERQIDTPMTMAPELGKARRIPDAEGRYIEFCKGTLPWGFNLKGLTIVVDCANGANYSLAPKVFGELGARVIAIGNAPDGVNINLDCGSTKLNQLQKQVLESHADIGIAFDGDGDRVLFVDERGEIVDGDQLLYLIAAYRRKHGGGCRGVVGTLMSNFGLELGLEALGISFERAKVGDRYVIEAMSNNDWYLGGESSGHIVCADVTTTGDGVIAALQVLQAVMVEEQGLHDLKQRMHKMPQVMINVPVTNRVDVNSHEEIQAAMVTAAKRMQGKGRVLLRPSGTEPVIRVMVEGQEPNLVSAVAQDLAQVVSDATA